MITCSKCGELLEDGTEVCYFCKHHLTASERVNADRIAEDYKPVLAAMKEYKKRTKRGLTVIAVAILILLIIAYVFLTVELPSGILVACLIIWLIAFLVGLVWSKMDCCPWCDAYQGKRARFNSMDGIYCWHCGKKITTFYTE